MCVHVQSYKVTWTPIRIEPINLVQTKIIGFKCYKALHFLKEYIKEYMACCNFRSTALYRTFEHLFSTSGNQFWHIINAV